jgi:hypothetical protein
MECEAWSKWDTYFKEQLNCTLKTSKGTYVKIRATRAQQEAYIHALPTFAASSLPDGICTWIVYTSKTASTPTFVATRVHSAFEVGTAHKVLALRVRATHIRGAGELKKAGHSVSFNTESGTYTCHMKDAEAGMVETIEHELRAFKTTHVHETFITKSLPVGDAEIAEYRSAGFQVDEYPDKKSCREAKGGRRRRKTRRRKS